MKKIFGIFILSIGIAGIISPSVYATETIGVGLPSDTCLSEISGNVVNEKELNKKLNEEQKTNICKTQKEFSKSVQDIAKILSGLAGSFAVAMIVYGGYQYVTSAGEPEKLEDAKNYVFYAGLGLFVILLGFVIMSTINAGLT